MLLMASAALLSAASADASPARSMPIVDPKSGLSPTCPATSRYEASGRANAPKAQKLNELPDADVYRAVFRRIGVCEVPIIVRYGVGR